MDQERFEVWEVSDARERVADDIRDAGDSMNVVQRAKDAVGRIPDNPMLMLAGGMAIGFLLGMLLPISRFENERLGPVADDLKDRAREAIKEQIDSATGSSAGSSSSTSQRVT